ncbi:septation protein SepH [Raineyella fluvialis]|uniref:DUF3071 domain-containing protein n=1 Tax=Raineyella fluvialis TaxID=2662261 RepID=A0A5Q2FJD8_9ACTN|nr:septation protein SepH [Raineyella fluvialis]QGF24775.1 DUF3071 domain-containing protein [Raineyella fluvialis]
MDSSLTLREIQDRLRSGSSVEEVALEAGVEPAELAGYAVPIVAEREHIADLARAANVRRAGESPAHRGLEAVVTERLRALDLDPREVEWSAVRVERRHWQVIAVLTEDEESHRAVFNFDLDGRYSVAANEAARWMLGESPLPPLDLDTEPTVELTEEERRARMALADDFDEDWDDDGPTEMDALNEMMSEYEDTLSGYEDTLSILRGFGGDREAYAGPRLVPDPADDEAASDEDRYGPSERSEDDSDPGAAARRPSNRAASRAAAQRRPRPDSDQPPLVESDVPVPRKRTPRKRAHVPSWDEIVFGSGSDGQDS